MNSQDRHGNKATRKVVVSLTGTAMFDDSAEVVLEVPRKMTHEMLASVLDDNIPDLTDRAKWTHKNCDDFQLNDGQYGFADLDEDNDVTATLRLLQDKSGDWILRKKSRKSHKK